MGFRFVQKTILNGQNAYEVTGSPKRNLLWAQRSAHISFTNLSVTFLGHTYRPIYIPCPEKRYPFIFDYSRPNSRISWWIFL